MANNSIKPQRTVAEVIAKAKRRRGGVKGGLVICEHCENPASLACSTAMSWTGCSPCMFGEADSFDVTDLIFVPEQADK